MYFQSAVFKLTVTLYIKRLFSENSRFISE